MVFGGSSGGKTPVHNDDLSHTQILAECAKLGGQMWEDRVFTAQGNRALYLPRGSTAQYSGGNKIKWLRPHEVNGVTQEIALTRDGTDAGDVIQG